MKTQLLYLALTGMLLTACNDNKKQEDDLMHEVIELHDKVMAKDEKAVKNKILLDSLVKTKQVTDVKAASTTVNSLRTADKAMENWMHQFSADKTGKEHDEIMQYLNEQKKLLMQVDSQLTTAIAQSNTYIPANKK